MSQTGEELERAVTAARGRLEPLLQEVGRVIVGLRPLLDRLVIGLLTDGHILIEGVPGLAKTLAVRTLAGAMQLHFQRIQFTPDLLPADIIGTQVFNPRTGEFTVKRGPIFAQVVLADEINRSPAKVQAALLEAMQERQVTIGEQTFPLAQPFLVLATQNPIEHEGTYPLPEAQVDRFMLKVKLNYPSRDEELLILDRMGRISPDLTVQPMLGPGDIDELRRTVDQVYVDEKINAYIVDLVRATRSPSEYGLDLDGLIQYGASPRATIFLKRSAKALALLQGRCYVTPQDVKAMAPDVLRHRVLVTYEAEAEELDSDAIISRILLRLPVP
ncbi:MAG: MoxR family ATPase [Gemmataceae bacterium]|nr:MoxR family ATPase [Gemmataceae bacterium]